MNVYLRISSSRNVYIIISYSLCSKDCENWCTRIQILEVHGFIWASASVVAVMLIKQFLLMCQLIQSQIIWLNICEVCLYLETGKPITRYVARIHTYTGG